MHVYYEYIAFGVHFVRYASSVLCSHTQTDSTQLERETPPRCDWLALYFLLLFHLNHYCSIPTVKRIYNNNMHMPFTDASNTISMHAHHTIHGHQQNLFGMVRSVSIYSGRLCADSSGVSFFGLWVFLLRLLYTRPFRSFIIIIIDDVTQTKKMCLQWKSIRKTEKIDKKNTKT